MTSVTKDFSRWPINGLDGNPKFNKDGNPRVNGHSKTVVNSTRNCLNGFSHSNLSFHNFSQNVL